MAAKRVGHEKLKFEVNRLTREELEYELKIRNCAASTESSVDGLRKALRAAIKYVAEESLNSSFSYPFTFEQDVAGVSATIFELDQLLTLLGNDPSSESNCKKFRSKSAHCLGRISRMIGDTAERMATIAGFRTHVFTALDSLEVLLKPVPMPRQSTALDLAMCSITEHTPTVESDSSTHSDEEEPHRPTVKSVPVRLWNITFSGEPNTQSLHAFLARIDELKVARGINRRVLLESAVDLFTGKALIWFRANKKSFRTWENLVQGLKDTFLPWNYEHQLFEEIKKRTQGTDESISIYMAVMTNLFDRLSSPISEEFRLQILMTNIDPFYQPYLAFAKITKVSELLSHCQQLENRRDVAKSFVRPSESSTALEPDLAYVRAGDPSVATSPRSLNVTQVSPPNPAAEGRCFYCQATGHFRRDCPKRRGNQIRCHGCGKPGIIRPNCPDCSANRRSSNVGSGSGNAEPRQ